MPKSPLAKWFTSLKVSMLNQDARVTSGVFTERSHMRKPHLIEAEAALMFFAHRHKCTLLDAALLHHSFALELFLQTNPLATKEALRAILDFLDDKIDAQEYGQRGAKAAEQLRNSAKIFHGLAPTEH